MRRSRKRKKQRKIIVVSVIGLLCIMSAGYAAFQTNLNISAKGNIIEKSRVIKSRTPGNNEYFYKDLYRHNIVTINFLDNREVPNNAIETWDVSEANDEGVLAWITANQNDNTKYDLYIGANKGVIANENSSNFFRDFTNVTIINFNNNFDTSNVINMCSMFADNSNIKTLDLSSFNTSNVTDMSYIFANNINLTTVNVKSFNTSNVTNMGAMFRNCKKLDVFNLMGFDTSKVTNMSEMFNYCESIPLIHFGENFNTSNVTNMSYMFANMKNVTVINICAFNTNKVTDMRYMFANTSNMDKVSVSANWKTTQATISNMWSGSKISTVKTGEC